jgi:hypothetical protein
MNGELLSAMLITLLTDDKLCYEMPRCVVSALCAINMLLLLEDNDFAQRRHRFKDFIIEPQLASDGARIVFTKHHTADIIVDKQALTHIKQVGNFRQLRMCAKL